VILDRSSQLKSSIVSVHLALIALGFTGGGLSASAQHLHLVTGAESKEQNAKLRFTNGSTYDIYSNQGIAPACFFMSSNLPALYPNLYQTDVTFASLPGTLWTGGPALGAAAPGAFLEAIIVSVQGPLGGVIGFWQEDEGAMPNLRFSIPVGTTNGTNQFEISEGITFPELDPFGHIHGRRFTANTPGLYTLGFQLIDTSTAGTNGGSIHTPSSISYFYFQAGVVLNSISKSNNAVTVQFGVNSFYDYDLDVATNLENPEWVSIYHVVGANHSDLHYYTDMDATNSHRFYRVRETPQ
jgi:hypothetical protein